MPIEKNRVLYLYLLPQKISFRFLLVLFVCVRFFSDFNYDQLFVCFCFSFVCQREKWSPKINCNVYSWAFWKKRQQVPTCGKTSRNQFICELIKKAPKPLFYAKHVRVTTNGAQINWNGFRMSTNVYIGSIDIEMAKNDVLQPNHTYSTNGWRYILFVHWISWLTMTL